MTWHPGDEFDCYECGKSLRPNVVYDKLHFYNDLTKKHTNEYVCADCYEKAMNGPDDDLLEAESQPVPLLDQMREAQKLK
jgi:hypothetical protein